jgi:predicted ATPase
VVPVALAATGAQETPGRTALESLGDRFASRSALIVIDNCEHVLSAAVELVRALRAAAPEVRVLATSREALAVRGEHLVPVGSLPSDDGVALFVERARTVQPELDVEADRAVIEQICARLDGIPLAIELAAARCRSMLPTEIDDLLGDRFRLLRGGRQGAERHRTLQAAVAWSYEMLDDDERHVFHHLAVCAGGMLVEGLVVVTGLDRFDLLDVLDRLVARSMVTTARTALGTRYSQLETLRQFAEDRLVEAGTIDAVRDRHLAWVGELAAWVAASNGTPRAAEAFVRFCAEVDNLRVAIAHAVGTGRHPLAHGIVTAVASQARARPVHEVFDWVHPIQLDDGWTGDAAICAALRVVTDLSRGIRPPDGPIGGVPAALIDDIPTVAALQAQLLLLTGRPWREARELVERVQSRHPHAQFVLMGPWLLSFYFGVLADDASDDDLDLLRRRGHDFVEAVRRSGDDLLLASTLATLALAQQLLESAADDVVRLADEVIGLGERLGASAVQQNAIIARYTAGIHKVPATASGRAETAAAVRNAIAGAMDNQATYFAGVLTNAAFRLLADTEPEVAIVMALVWQRFAVGGVARRLQFARIPMPTDLGEYERRAASLSVLEAIGMVVAALDRLIAAESVGVERGAG